MADETAALVVALSAQLTKFEKDMRGAVDIADKRTREIETRFSAMNDVIVGRLSQIGNAATAQIGIAGSALSALGPLGVAAAVALGTVVGGMLALSSATAEFAAKAKNLKEASETAGLTITQFKLLGQAGQKVGLDFDETSAFFTKFIANIEALRNGGGPLYEALLKIDVGLLRQLSATKDNAQAIDLLVAAYQRLDNQAAKLNLARAAGGRAGLTGGRLLESLGDRGGLTGLQATSDPIDEEQIKRAALLKTEIEAIEKKTANIWGGMFSDDILQKQKASAEVMLQLAQNIEKVAKGKDRITAGGDYDALGNFLGGISREAMPEGSEAAPSFAERFGGVPGNKGLVPFTRSKPQPPGPAPASVELQILQKNIALLGDAVTQGEQWRLKRLEIAAAAEKGGVNDGVAQRALDAFKVSMQAAAVAARERFGVATEEQIVESRLAQLQQDRAKFGLTDNEVQKASVVIMREAKDAADALTVRQSYLPGLTRLAIDAQNARKTLDEFASNGFSTITDGLADIVTGTKTAADAFKSMATSIINDLARIAIRKSITGPLASALGGLLPGQGGGSGGILEGPAALGLEKFDGGGWTGPGGRNVPAGIVHRGEFVFDQDAVGRIGISNLMRLQRGYADGGYVGMPTPGMPRGGRGDGGVNLQIVNTNGSEVTHESARNADGGVDLRVTIARAVADDMARPGGFTNRALQSNFAVRQQVARR